MYGLHFSSKMLFLEDLGKNIRKLSQRSLFFVFCRLNVYRSALVLINFLCSEKIPGYTPGAMLR